MVGANAWCRTSMLTFDRNVSVKKKANYGGIKEYLERKNIAGSFPMAQLQNCVARNKHRKSSEQYKGVGKVLSQHTRKGFTLKYNPDTHYSGALYRRHNSIQYTDGKKF